LRPQLFDCHSIGLLPHAVAADGSGLIGPSIEHNSRFNNWHPDTSASQIVQKQVEGQLGQLVSADSFATWLERIPSEDGAGRIAVFVRSMDHPEADAAKAAIDGLPDMIATINICSPIGD